MVNDQKGYQGILKGLKRILFAEEPNTTSNIPDANVNTEIKDLGKRPEGTGADLGGKPNGASSDIKLKIYQLLESINKPGVDFFEVWNAAVEMGGANVNNLRAAFTSLKFADKSLTKAQILQTGDYYVQQLQSVFGEDVKKRQLELQSLETQQQTQQQHLSQKVQQIQQNIDRLNQELAQTKSELDGLERNYAPKRELIQQKIGGGQAAVQEVLSEMKTVLTIIDTEIS